VVGKWLLDILEKKSSGNAFLDIFKKMYKVALMKTLKKIAFPLLALLALFWGIGAWIHRFLYEKKIKKRHRIPIKSICLGNLTVGGTGKTPHAEYFAAQAMAQGKKVAILSRGYGRKTSGFILANAAHTALEIGDEPRQYVERWGAKPQKIVVAVAENRWAGVQQLLSQVPDIELLILDDAFQHYRVEADFYWLLSDYARPFYADSLLPLGRLRERQSQAKRADGVIITKCPPDLSSDNKQKIKQAVSRYVRPNTPILFSTYDYGEPVLLTKKQSNPVSLATSKIILLTGIANAKPFYDYLSRYFEIIQHLDYQDHYQFGEADLKRLENLQKTYTCPIYTTEKDAMRMKPLLYSTGLNLTLYYVPIRVRLLP
jgi:tetraacyldisaccharide 4'-kinase